VGAKSSFNQQASVGGAFAVVSAPLSLDAGPYVVIGKLYVSSASQGTVTCELRAAGVTLDYSGAYLNLAAAPAIPMSLVGTVTVATGPQSLVVVCKAPAGGTAEIAAVQLVAVQVNVLDAPN
jgi:hypothetical protein